MTGINNEKRKSIVNKDTTPHVKIDNHTDKHKGHPISLLRKL